MLTVGFEGAHSSLDDDASMTQLLGGRRDKNTGKVLYDLKERLPTGISNVRGGHSSQTEWAVFVEDNISATQSTILTPSLRYDYNSYSGSNVSGGLNFLQSLNDDWRIKGGIARAYKAPNLYQTNPNYLLFTLGQGVQRMYQIIKLVISKVIATLNRKPAGIKKSELNMIKMDFLLLWLTSVMIIVTKSCLMVNLSV